MTRATYIVLHSWATIAAGLLSTLLLSSELLAQNPQPQPATASRYAPPAGQAATQQQPQQPQRSSVYGPAVAGPQQQGPQQQGPQRQGPQPQGSQYQVQPAQGQAPTGQLQGGQVRPVADQQPIRQPGAPGAAQPQGIVGPPILGPNDPRNIPRMQIVQPMPQQPEWFPLDPQVQEWVDNVLTFWEKRSNEVKTLECKFQKWEYDPAQIPGQFNQLKALGKINEMPFTRYAAGVIKYGAPDKGLFKVEQLQVIEVGKQQPDGKQKYEPQPKENGEHWVTDGKRVFAFDALRKEVSERTLPPDMQGKALADGPLPFMFGARAESIKARYWIRPLKPEAAGEYCLEAVPKSRQDAANFKMVQIVLDEKVYLPIRMQIFEGDWSPANPHRTAYRFADRIENEKSAVAAMAAVLNPLNLPNPWARAFYDVATPPGWKRIVYDANGNVVGGGGAANTATAPVIGPALK